MSQREPSPAEQDQPEQHGFRNRVGRAIGAMRVSWRTRTGWLGKAAALSARIMRLISRLFTRVGLTGTLAVLIAILMLVETFRPPRVVFDEILVPGELVDMGYTPQVVAARLIDAANFLRPKTRPPSADPTSMAHSIRDVDLELGALGISFSSIVAFAREFTGRDLHVVTGEILHHEAKNRVLLRLRIDGRRVFDGSAGLTDEGVEALLAEGAHVLMQWIEPSAVAFHHLSKGATERAAEVVAFMLENASSGDEYAKAFFALGHHHLLSEEFGEATRAYNRAIEFDHEFSAAHGMRGVALAEQGNMKAAIESFRKSIEIHPDSATIHYNWGKALYELGDLDGAIRHYGRAVRADPGFADSHYNWGIALAEQGDTEGAIGQYRRAVRADPRHAGTHNNWGLALAERGDTEGAIEQYRRAVWAEPSFAPAHYNWGNLLRRRGETARAMEQYRRAVGIDPGHPYARINLGNLFLQRGDADGAIEQYRRVVRADPGHADAYYNWGLALAEQGEPEGAIERFERAVQADPTDSAAYQAWAHLRLKLGDCGGAAEKFREAKKLDHSLIEPTCENPAQTPLEMNWTGTPDRSLN